MYVRHISSNTRSSPLSFKIICYDKKNCKGNDLLQKATFPHLITKFPAFYATRQLITAFTRPRHLSLSSTTLIHSTSSHSISFTFNIILPSTPMSSKLSPSFKFSHKTPEYAFFFCPIHATCHFQSHYFRFDYPNNIWSSIHKSTTT